MHHHMPSRPMYNKRDCFHLPVGDHCFTNDVQALVIMSRNSCQFFCYMYFVLGKFVLTAKVATIPEAMQNLGIRVDNCLGLAQLLHGCNRQWGSRYFGERGLLYLVSITSGLS